MIVVMKGTATTAEIDTVVKQVETMGYSAHLSRGTERTIIGVVGDNRPVQPHNFEMLSGVEQVVRILQPFKLAGPRLHPGEHGDQRPRGQGRRPEGHADRRTLLGRGPQPAPRTAHAVREAGADILRGGAFSPRTSPYAFQGMGEDGLELLAEGHGGDRYADHHRGDVPGDRAAGRQVRRHLPDRRTQQPELPPADRGGQDAHAGVPQAEHDGHDPES